MHGDQEATIDLMNQNTRLRTALAAMMEGSEFRPSPLYPDGAWQRICSPTESALNAARAALAEPVA